MTYSSFVLARITLGYEFIGRKPPGDHFELYAEGARLAWENDDRDYAVFGCTPDGQQSVLTVFKGRNSR